jgi:hypothetical protein
MSKAVALAYAHVAVASVLQDAPESDVDRAVALVARVRPDQSVERHDEEEPCPLPFHPLDLGERAMLEFFGFYVEGCSGEDDATEPVVDIGRCGRARGCGRRGADQICDLRGRSSRKKRPRRMELPGKAVRGALRVGVRCYGGAVGCAKPRRRRRQAETRPGPSSRHGAELVPRRPKGTPRIRGSLPTR